MYEQIKQHAKKVFPEECCGFVLKNKSVFECKNVAIDKKVYFKISGKDFLKAEPSGIQYIYHSHTNGNENFSQIDLKGLANLGYGLILYDIVNDEFKTFKNE